MLSGCSKKAYRCGLSQTDADITHQPNLPLMPDELAGHSGDGRRSATVQQLSITHTVGACSYFTPPLSKRDECCAGGLIRSKNLLLLFYPSSKANLYGWYLCIWKTLLFFLNQMSCEMWSIMYDSINYIDHISQNNLSASHYTRLTHLKVSSRHFTGLQREVLKVTCLSGLTLSSDSQ